MSEEIITILTEQISWLRELVDKQQETIAALAGKVEESSSNSNTNHSGGLPGTNV